METARGKYESLPWPLSQEENHVSEFNSSGLGTGLFKSCAKHPHTIQIPIPHSYQVVGKRNMALPFPHTEVRSPCILPAQKTDSIPSHV